MERLAGRGGEGRGGRERGGGVGGVVEIGDGVGEFVHLAEGGEDGDFVADCWGWVSGWGNEGDENGRVKTRERRGRRGGADASLPLLPCE